jgi:hypothetical protein
MRGKGVNRQVAVLILLLGLLMASCSGSGSAASDEDAVPESSESLALAPRLLPTPTGGFRAQAIEPTPTTMAPLTEATQAGQATTGPNRLQATPLPPEAWRRWPIVPTLSPEMLEVYQAGIELGNDLHAFSKVGDCQNIPDAFLGVYDNPERYALDPDYAYLQETIDWFAGYFVRDSLAVEGGFSFPAVFSPLRADSEVCEPGETPLECEFRIVRPSFVFISMEFWYRGRTAENYADYLRQTVEFALARGVVPILATKADNVEGDHSLNRTTAQIADEYRLPLWNFWLAVQPLPSHGIDLQRDPQGFHISYEAWNWRSFTALQTLDRLWRETAPLRASTNPPRSNDEQ